METIKNILTKNYKIILIVLVGLFVLWTTYTITTHSTMTQDGKTKIDSLTNVIDKIQTEQKKINVKIEIVNDEVIKIDDNISIIKSEKNKNGEKYHGKISRVDTYTDLELDSFFTSRYK